MFLYDAIDGNFNSPAYSQAAELSCFELESGLTERERKGVLSLKGSMVPEVVMN